MQIQLRNTYTQKRCLAYKKPGTPGLKIGSIGTAEIRDYICSFMAEIVIMPEAVLYAANR